MTRAFLTRRVLLGGALAVAMGTAAAAHHGWTWTADEVFTLTGTVEAVSVGNPHAQMTIRSDGQVWQVDLAPPSQTIRAGFTEGIVKIGDTVTVIGHRSRDPLKHIMKGVRVEHGGKRYDVYPDRARNL